MIRPGDRRMLRQLVLFLKVATLRGFFAGAQREKFREELASWIEEFRKFLDPVEHAREYKREVAPLMEVFEESRRQVIALTNIMNGWAISTTLENELRAKVGRIVAGESEEEDYERLCNWPSAFLSFFPGASLPKALTGAELKKQIEAHKKAHDAMPPTTAWLELRRAFAARSTLRSRGEELWDRMHNMLDGDFGTGPGSYEQKKVYGYDRRLKGGGPNRRRRKEDQATEEKQPPAPPPAPPPGELARPPGEPGPVISGKAGAVETPSPTAPAPTSSGSASSDDEKE